MTPDQQKIHDLHTVWIDAVNRADLPRVLSLMSDDAIFFNPGRAPFGRDEFSSTFSAAHQEFRVHCTSDLEEVVVVGEIAYTRSRDVVSVTNRSGGETTHLAGHRMTIYRKQPEGRWLLARDVHTLSPVEK